jgi:hypothetical protein
MLPITCFSSQVDDFLCAAQICMASESATSFDTAASCGRAGVIKQKAEDVTERVSNMDA